MVNPPFINFGMSILTVYCYSMGVKVANQPVTKRRDLNLSKYPTTKYFNY